MSRQRGTGNLPPASDLFIATDDSPISLIDRLSKGLQALGRASWLPRPDATVPHSIVGSGPSARYARRVQPISMQTFEKRLEKALHPADPLRGMRLPRHDEPEIDIYTSKRRVRSSDRLVMSGNIFSPPNGQ